MQGEPTCVVFGAGASRAATLVVAGVQAVGKVLVHPGPALLPATGPAGPGSRCARVKGIAHSATLP
jgi:hypothetical protein